MDNKGISKLDLKRRNRKQILLAIRQEGMLARVDIAAHLALTRAAVTIITNQMVAQNILIDLNTPLPEDDDAPKRKGRKKTMIRINPNYRYILGAVIGETHVSVGVSNLANENLGHFNLPLTDDTKPEEIISFIVNSCRSLMKKTSLNAKQILGLGVGIVPARWEQMRGERNGQEVSFSKLCYLLEMELSLPVMAASAISLYAMANADYSKLDTGNQLLLYTGESYHFAVLSEHSSVDCQDLDTALVNRMIIVPAGEKLEGYPDGCVRAELGKDTMIRRLKEAGSDVQPEEAHIAYGNGDATVISVVDGQLDRLATLIYNLCIATGSNRITLQNYHAGEPVRTKLRERVASFCSNPADLEVCFSDIEGELDYLAGCALAAEKQFYELGGMSPSETMQ